MGTQELSDAQSQIQTLLKENVNYKKNIGELKAKISDQEEETQTLKDKIKRDTEKISKHIRQSSQELLNEKDKTQLLQQLAVIQMEITELLASHSSFSDGYIGEGGSGNRDTSEE